MADGFPDISRSVSTPGQNLGPYTSLVFSLPGYIAVIAFIASKANYSLSKNHWVAMAVGVLYMISNLSYYKLCETVDVSKLAPVTAMYVVIPVILGWVLLKEPVTIQKIVGIILAGAALCLLTAHEK